MQPVRSSPRLVSCPRCALVQTLLNVPPSDRARCARCGALVFDPHTRALHRERALAAALAALVLWPPAIFLPVLRLQKFGLESEASIWQGSVGLLRAGEFFVGGVVLFCSVILPLVKLFAIVALTAGRGLLSAKKRALTYRWIEIAGRYGMLDVLLIAMLVAWVKLGSILEIEAGPAAIAFCACVLTSLLSSAWFDPHAIWEREGPRVGPQP